MEIKNLSCPALIGEMKVEDLVGRSIENANEIMAYRRKQYEAGEISLEMMLSAQRLYIEFLEMVIDIYNAASRKAGI